MKAVYDPGRIRVLSVATLLVLPLGISAGLLAPTADPPATSSAVSLVGKPAASDAEPASTEGAEPASTVRPPVHFEENRGQADPSVRYLYHGADSILYLAPGGATWKVLVPGSENAQAMIQMRFVGASPSPRMDGVEAKEGGSNYYIGADPSGWITDVPHYGRVVYEDVYPGIDLAFYGRDSAVEYDFIVAPGSDPGRIRLAFEGADQLDLQDDGTLLISRGGTPLLLQKPPVLWQLRGAERLPVEGRFAIVGDEVAFVVETLDPALTLVIDPVTVTYTSFLGGSAGDGGGDVAVDSRGFTTVVGNTLSTDFPTWFEIQGDQGAEDVFVTKFLPCCDGYVYSTYIGGSNREIGGNVAVDANGNAYVVGWTASNNLPTTTGAWDTTYGGSDDAFVAKLDPYGFLVYLTYVGSSGDDQSNDIAVDSLGNAYIIGETSSGVGTLSATSWPATTGAYQTAKGSQWDAFVTKINAAGSAPVYSSLLGGNSHETSSQGIAVDAVGNAYATGITQSTNFPTLSAADASLTGAQDAFVTKLDTAGSGLVWSTYLGGDGTEIPREISVDADGKAWVVGMTDSCTSFPLTPGGTQTACPGGAEDGFVTVISANGNSFVCSTYYGGSAADQVLGIAVASTTDAWITGFTDSTFISLFDNAGVQLVRSVGREAFVARITCDGLGGMALPFSSFLGGSGSDAGVAVAIGPAGLSCGPIWVVGSTGSADLFAQHPLVEGADKTYNGGTTDAFLVALTP